MRSTAVKVTLECCAIAGRAVEKFLPKNLKPAIRDVIDEGLGIKTGGAGAAAETRGGGYGRRDPARRNEPRRARAVVQTRVARRARYASGAAGGIGSPPRRFRGTPRARARAQALRSPNASSRSGRTHPDVAVALTDLAALHSEEENFAAAQPLYERALRIQEKTLGAEHQDTVQTLTDLAICHLDQGHNDVGRPLLERALVLQEQALGSDHPDVTAIRDVLQSLEADEA